MRLKSFLVFLIIGSSIAFAGLPVRQVVTTTMADKSMSPSEQNSTIKALDNVIALAYILSVLGVASFIIIRIFEVVTNLDLMGELQYNYNMNARTHYAY